jgi:hypothetical protein
MALQPFVGPCPLFQFLDLLYTVGRTPWMGDQPVTRPLPAHRTPQTQNKCTQTSMPQVGFESTIPAFEQTKTVQGRAIAQAVSRRLPTAAARVQTRVWSCVILWWTQVALGQVFFRQLWFPLPIYIPSASPQSSSLSPEAGTIGQEWPQCQ